MEQRTRHRITGSVFLLSMAFILTILMQDGAELEVDDVPDLQIDMGSVPRVPSYDDVAPESDVVEVIQELKNQILQNDEENQKSNPILLKQLQSFYQNV